MSVLILNEQNFQQVIAEGITVIDFWATWCGPCKMLSPIMEELAQKFKDKVKIAKVDIDNNQQLTEKLDISAVPTMIFFKDGNEVERFTGVKSQEEITQKIENHLLIKS